MPCVNRALLIVLILLFSGLCGAWSATQATAEETANSPSKGFMALFNGKDLSGWHGLGHFDPRQLAKMTAEERAKKLAADNTDMRKHWRVEGGEIVSDGHGVFLTTDKDYGDFELKLEWKMVAPGGDSGVYLRGSPQVQIWDPANAREKKNGADKGSGGLWNNNADNPGRFPLVKADRPIGEWNTMAIRMVGPKVTVHLNDKLVVDNAVLDNFWDRKSPMFPTGPIQLQTHGSEMRFRNVFIR
ncbi:MAG: DUF1080 domain-containing protein [Planctomycetes bacterium]|nr:DUF1080 domain-containing protein [Planctomycetota bacterium]